MFRAKHIAKTLLLIAVLLLLAAPRYAHAQNSSAAPYLNSTHLYRVKMGDVANTPTWQLTNLTSSLSPIVLDAQSWITHAKIDRAGTAEDSAYVTIKFVNTVFNVSDGTWTLIYSEMNGDDCIAKRSFDITPTDNSFYLTLGDDDTNCNALNDQVLNWDDIDWKGQGHSGTNTPIPTYVDFTVKMNKAPTFTISSWLFDDTISFLNSNFSYISARAIDSSATGTSALGLSFAITQGSGNKFSVLVNGPSTSVASDSIVLRVYISGLIYVGEGVLMTVKNGVARSGTNYVTRTDDDVGKGSGDRQQVQIILPLPATSNIAIAR